MHKRSRLGPGGHVYFFFYEIPKYVHDPCASTWINISWKWANILTKLAGDGKCRLAVFHAIRYFLANEIYHFSGLSHQTVCIFTWAAFSIELAPYSAPYSKKAILQKILKLKFQNSKIIFLRMHLSLVATSFPLILVICLSRSLHLKLSREFLTLVLFNIWR